MPIKKDVEGKRWVEMELLVPGTPEQVWRAVATGPGYSGWFSKTEIEERVGGVVRFELGEGEVSVGEVTDWQPPERFGYVERDWDKGAPPIATQVTISARSGDRCVLRIVHSLFTSSEAWDDQVEGFESGWQSLLEVLRVYLAHFVGQESAFAWVMLPAKSDPLSTWQRLGEALGLSGASVDERRRGTFGGEPWSGVVEHVHQDGKQRYCLVRLLEPRPGMLIFGTYTTGETARASVCRYFYGDDAETQAAESKLRLRELLSTTFPSSSPSS